MKKHKDNLPLPLLIMVGVALLAAAFTSDASECYGDMTTSQKDVLYKAYKKGADHDLGYTMMAIAWKESTAGKYRVNLNSMDFGVMQNSLKTASTRTGTKGYYKKMELVEALIKDDKLSMNLALEELLYWRKQVDGWRNMVMAYNVGWAYGGNKSYLKDIVTNVKRFQKCGIADLVKAHYWSKMPVYDSHFELIPMRLDYGKVKRW